jgi:hypothetical protein
MSMRSRITLTLALVALACVHVVPARPAAQEPQKPVVAIPKPGVSEIMTMEGKFVRAAYNNEGYVILGYQLANRSIGEEWMLLEVGMTLREGQKNQTFKREAVSLNTPDGKTVPLATIAEHRDADTRALQNRERVQRDSINYFPPMANQACRIGFFAEIDQRVAPWDQVELSYMRACLGRFFFKVPGGITHGQHWLNVQFQNSLIRVPFRILTADEEKMLSKNYKSIKKQIDDAFKKKKK